MNEDAKKTKIMPLMLLVAAFAVLVTIGIATN